MVILNILVIVFGISVTIGLLYNTFSMIGGTIYDLKALKRDEERQRHPYSKVNRHRPFISIIVPAHNESLVIERCLSSILKSTYRKFEIIVVDDASSDNTTAIIRKFIQEHPNRSIHLMAKRKNTGKGGAINAAFKTYAKGDFIMTLDSDCVIDRYALKRVTRHFADPTVCALAPNVRIIESNSVLGTMQQFEYLGGFRSKKFNSLSNSEYIVGGAGAIYTREIFKRLRGFDESMQTEDIALSLSITSLGNKDYRIKYASDVLVSTEHAPNYKSLLRQRYRWKFGGLQAIYFNRHLLFNGSRRYTKMLTWVRLPLAVWGEIQLLLEPFFFSYFLLLAIVFKNPTLFLVACIMMTIFLLLIVWSDEHLSLTAKIKMTGLAPFMYFVFYVMTTIQIAAALRCLKNAKLIVNRTLVRGAWLSPERIG